MTGTGIKDPVVETITITAPQPQALEKSGRPAQLGQGTVVFAPGVTSVTLDIVPINDQQAGDPDRTVQLSLTGYQSQYVLGNPPPPTVTIVNDNLPNVGIQADAYTADAASGAAGSLVVTRDGSTNQPLTVALSATGTATPGLDYVRLPTSVTIAAGSSTASIAITPIDRGALDSLRQSIVVPVAAGGTYTLTLGDDTTAPLAYDADAATVQAGLEASPGVGGTE